MKKKNSQSGAALVEFAIVLPLLLLLIFGMIEFSLLLYDKAVITNASREAARAGIVYRPADETLAAADIEQVALDYCENYLITFGDGATPPLNAQLLTAPCADVPGADLQVEVTYQYDFLVFPDIAAALFSGDGTDSIMLTARTTMRCE